MRFTPAHIALFSAMLGCAIFCRAQQAPVTAAKPPAIIGGAELMLVAKVTGEATCSIRQRTMLLHADESVAQGSVIKTSKNASVVLMCSNGVTLMVSEDTELEIVEFRQDPFMGSVKVVGMKTEPSRSRTRLRLQHGEVIADVKRLNEAGGSTFTIETPVGPITLPVSKSAPVIVRPKNEPGSDGETTFRLAFQRTGVGAAHFALNVTNGALGFAPSPGTPPIPATSQGLSLNIRVGSAPDDPVDRVPPDPAGGPN